MQGHIEKRGASSWRLVAFAGTDGDTGRKLYARRTVRGTKRDAQTALARLVAEIADGRYAKPSATTVAELLDRWLELKAHQVAATTLANYRIVVDQYLRRPLGPVRLAKLRAADLDRLYGRLLASGGKSARPLSPRTVRLCHVVIRQALAQARRWGMVAANIAEDATPPRSVHAEITPPSSTQVLALIEAAMVADPDFGTYLRVLAATGCRRGEALALRWRDLTIDGAGAPEVVIARSIATTPAGPVEKDTKTHQSRRLVIDAGTAVLLCGHRSRQGERARLAGAAVGEGSLVFSSSLDATVPWRPDVMTNRFARLCAEVGIEGVRLHDLRHYVATHLGAAGTPIATISARLGHRDRATTLNIYSHSLPALDAQAAEVIGATLNGATPQAAARPDEHPQAGEHTGKPAT